MLSLLVSLLLAAPNHPAILSTILVPQAEAEHIDLSTTTLRAFVERQAIRAGVPTNRALYIAENESHFNATARGDLDITCTYKKSPHYGEPVTARGMWQITRCYHWDVTDEQADDPVFSTAWAMEQLGNEATCKKEWTTCRAYLSGASTASPQVAQN